MNIRRHQKAETELITQESVRAEPFTLTFVADTVPARFAYELAAESGQVASEVSARMAETSTSVAELSHDSRLSQQDIRRILNQESNVSIDGLSKVAAALRSHVQVTLVPAPAGQGVYAPSDKA